MEKFSINMVPPITLASLETMEAAVVLVVVRVAAVVQRARAGLPWPVVLPEMRAAQVALDLEHRLEIQEPQEPAQPMALLGLEQRQVLLATQEPMEQQEVVQPLALQELEQLQVLLAELVILEPQEPQEPQEHRQPSLAMAVLELEKFQQ